MAQIVDTHRELWIELSRLVRQTGYAMTYTYGFYILYMFISLTFFVYHTVSNLARQLRADQVLMAIECCVMEYTLYLICSAANNATRNVSLPSLFPQLLYCRFSGFLPSPFPRNQADTTWLPC